MTPTTLAPQGRKGCPFVKSSKRSLPLFAALAAVGSGFVLIAATALANEPLKAPGIDWDTRADKWFTAPKEDEAARKAQMKEASRALKRPCKFCHTEDFSGFVDDKRKQLVQQMMIVSAEHGVECKDCHSGRDTMTELGETAKKMYAVAREKTVFCDDCHQTNKSKFKDLTDKGKKFKEETEAKEKAGSAPAPASAPASEPK